MTKIKVGADTTKDLQALELEVDEAATKVAENIDFEGDGGAGDEGVKDRYGEPEGGSEWEPIKILLEGDEDSNKTNTTSNTRL
jgi:hypothetical protein